MRPGEKLRQARLEAGLSQRQLCGNEITRNMLSQIENGTARPSIRTLEYLARQLGKPVSYFLEDRAEESTVLSHGLDLLDQARDALSKGKTILAAQLLENITAPALLREKLLLQSRLPDADMASLCRQLPSLDGELLLRARGGLAVRQPDRAIHLLEAAEIHTSPEWLLLRGQAHMQLKEYAAAAQYLHGAEDALPHEILPMLEICYRELGDFEKAYVYACRQR